LRRSGALNERERHILTERRLKGEPVTLEDLSQEYDVSRERIGQIEVPPSRSCRRRFTSSPPSAGWCRRLYN
jgi:RNA polymerase sigma-32 factor